MRQAPQAGCLPNGASVIVTGSGHVAPLFEAAPAVLDLLTDFWANLVRWSPVSAPTRQPRHLTGQQPDSERQQANSARRGKSARRAPLIRQREDLGPATALPNVFALTGGVS